MLKQEHGPAVDEQRAYPGRDLDDLPPAGAFAVRRASVVDGQCAQQVINGVPTRSQRANAVQPQEEAIGSGQVQANGGQRSDNAVLGPAVTGEPDTVSIGNRAGGRLVEQVGLREAPECDYRIAMTVGEVAAYHREPRIRTGCGMFAQEARRGCLDRVHSDAGTCGNRKAGTRVVRRVRHARIDEQLMSSGPARRCETIGGKRLEQPPGEEAGAGAAVVIGVVDAHQRIGGCEDGGSGGCRLVRHGGSPRAKPQLRPDPTKLEQTSNDSLKSHRWSRSHGCPTIATMSAALPLGDSSGSFDQAAAGQTTSPRVRSRAELIHLAVTGAVAASAVAVIVGQQLVHTPWGLPGHRGLFWLSALIASRWIIDRPGAAIRIAATSSCLILVIAPATGARVVPYLVAALLVDRAGATQAIHRHPWLLLPLAPLIHLAGVLSPFVHELGISPLGTVLPGMWFYIQGHLLWGAAAGVAGLAVGVPGRKLMRRIDPSGC